MRGVTIGRRAFVCSSSAATAAFAVGGTGGAQALNRLKDENPGEFVLQRPCPLDPRRKISTIGFGGVRLPVKNGKLGSQMDPVDYETGADYVDYALAHGINWFDSGYKYHDGDSERFFGYALSRHPRESYWFCTKAPPWFISSLADAKRIFKEQLERTRMDYFDVYMLHSLIRPEDFKRTFVDTGALEYFREEKAKGRIRYLGFSFHGREDFLDELLAKDCWDAATILVNGIDWRGANRSEALLAKLKAKKVAVFGMESLAGGRLAKLRPQASALLKKARPELSDAAWSLKFAAERDGLTNAMTGFTRFEHLKEDIRVFNAAGYRPLSAADEAVYLEAMKINIGGGEGVPCSECAYCMPCPYGVDIPSVFHFWNMRIKWGRLPSVDDPADHAERLAFLDGWHRAFGIRRGAERCIGCGRCAKRCPQWQFNIQEKLGMIESYVESLHAAEPRWRVKK